MLRICRNALDHGPGFVYGLRTLPLACPTSVKQRRAAAGMVVPFVSSDCRGAHQIIIIDVDLRWVFTRRIGRRGPPANDALCGREGSAGCINGRLAVCGDSERRQRVSTEVHASGADVVDARTAALTRLSVPITPGTCTHRPARAHSLCTTALDCYQGPLEGLLTEAEKREMSRLRVLLCGASYKDMRVGQCVDERIFRQIQ